MGPAVNLHGNILEPPMSALGQKRTWRDQIAMSALPPIADIHHGNWNVRFGPILLQKLAITGRSGWRELLELAALLSTPS